MFYVPFPELRHPSQYEWVKTFDWNSYKGKSRIDFLKDIHAKNGSHAALTDRISFAETGMKTPLFGLILLIFAYGASLGIAAAGGYHIMNSLRVVPIAIGVIGGTMVFTSAIFGGKLLYIHKHKLDREEILQLKHELEEQIESDKSLVRAAQQINPEPSGNLQQNFDHYEAILTHLRGQMKE